MLPRGNRLVFLFAVECLMSRAPSRGGDARGASSPSPLPASAVGDATGALDSSQMTFEGEYPPISLFLSLCVHAFCQYTVSR